MIVKAEYNDLQELLNLQHLAYQSEAELFVSITVSDRLPAYP